MLRRVVPMMLFAVGLVLSTAATAGAATAAAVVPAVATPASAQDYQALERMLQDPKARAALLQTLRRLSQEQTQPSAPAEAAQKGAGTGFSRMPQNFTAAFLATTNDVIARSIIAIRALQDLVHKLVLSPEAPGQWRSIGRLALPAVAIGVLAYLLLWLVLLLARRPLNSVFNWASSGRRRLRPLRALLALGLGVLVGALALGLGWTLGGAVAAVLAKDRLALRGLLSSLLQAFVLVEAVRLSLRLFLGEKRSLNQLVLRSAPLARQLGAPLSRLAWLLGYGWLFVVPVVSRSVSDTLGHALIWLLSLLAFASLLRILLSQREKLTGVLTVAAERRGDTLAGWALQVLARIWLPLALGYLLLVLVALLLRPGDVLPFIGRASLETLVTVLLTLTALKLTQQWLGGQVSLPGGITRRLAALELRANQALPYLRGVVRGLILLVSFAVLMSVWHVADILAWMEGPTGQLVLGRLVSAMLIFASSLAIWVVIDSMIEARLRVDGSHLPSARLKTLLGLFRVVFAIVLGVLGGMMVLSALGLNIGPLLAGASVLGLAVGFGSQKLVQDVINGVFIQIENAISVGDVITVGGITGTAEMVTIRSVRIRDVQGVYHIVPYSNVTQVSNHTYNYANHVGIYGIAYREDIDQATQILQQAFDELITDPALQDKILEPMVVHGVVALGSSSVDIRISIKTAPGAQWAVGRAYNRLVKIHFDRAGIEIPFPQQTLWFGEDKEGTAVPLRIQEAAEHPGGPEAVPPDPE